MEHRLSATTWRRNLRHSVSTKNKWTLKLEHQPVIAGRLLLGEYTPHSSIQTSQRVQSGEVVHDYYPQIIDQDLWHRARAAVQIRRTASTGINRRGKIRNLFSGFVHCECGSSMQFVSKGNSNRGGYYLVCSKARYGASCEYVGHRYYSVQWVVLVALQRLLGTYSGSGEEESRQLSLEGALKDLKVKAENLANDIAENGPSPFISNALRETESKIVAIERDLDELQDQQVLNNEEIDIPRLTENINDISERLRLHQFLKRRLKSIKVYKSKDKIDIYLVNAQVISLSYSSEEDTWSSDSGMTFSVKFDTRWGQLS